MSLTGVRSIKEVTPDILYDRPVIAARIDADPSPSSPRKRGPSIQ
jgi:hypothetical protein